MFARKAIGDIIDWDGSYTRVCYHKGRTDSNFGHHDYQNASGLGLYHWHHSEGPHLHPHTTEGTSLIDLFKSYNGSACTTIKSSSGAVTYIFEGIIELEKDERYFTLEINGLNDSFYLIGDKKKEAVESFWGTDLNPVYVKRADSPWSGATGGFDILVNADYFKALVKKYCGLEEPGEDNYFVGGTGTLNLSVRPSPSRASGEVAKFAPGTKIKIVLPKTTQKEESTGTTFIQVYYDGDKIGWVSAEYVFPDKPVEFLLPVTVNGNYNGNPITLSPQTRWGLAGGGGYNGQPLKENGRYRVAVGPKILRPDYPDDGKVTNDDFSGFDKNITIILEDKSGAQIELPCIITDLKAHTFNKYPESTGANCIL